MGDNKRKDPRVIGYAKAIHTATMTPGYIRDFSRSGCQVGFMQAFPAVPGDLLQIEVIAEHDPSIAPFGVCLRVRWARADALWFSIGGEIETVSCPGGEDLFGKLVEYYGNDR
jgi:hypothetical protein